MKLTQINKQISLNHENHSYTWEGKDESIICLSVSEVLYGIKRIQQTAAMQYGSEIHLKIQEFIESGSPLTEAPDDIAHYIEVISLFKTTQLGACEKPYAALIEFVDGLKVYLCGTPDCIIDDTLFEFKTGGVYSSHKDQIDFYQLLTGVKYCVTVYKDSFTRYNSYPLSVGRISELETMIRERLRKIELKSKDPEQINNERLVELCLEKERVKDDLECIQSEIQMRTSSFGEKTLVCGLAGRIEFIRQSYIRKKVDTKLVEKYLPDAVSIVETQVTRTKWVR